MALIKEVKGQTPAFGTNVYLAENATVVGEVQMGDDCSVWFNAVVRGDVHYIKMGDKVNVQDGAVIHCTYQKAPTNIGNNEYFTAFGSGFIGTQYYVSWTANNF